MYHANCVGRTIALLCLFSVAFFFLAVGITHPLVAGRRQTVSQERAAKSESGARPGTNRFEVRFTDDSNLKVELKVERIELHTPHGKLEFPLADIRRIEFATRVPADVAIRVDAAVADLASNQFRVREAAAATLREIGEMAYPRLLQATTHQDAEVARRVESLLDELRSVLPEELLEVRKQDLVFTQDSKIAGRIDVEMFRASTTQFGEVKLKLAHMYSLQARGPEAEDLKIAGKQAQVESGGVWYAAEVKQVKAGKYFIHYTGWAPTFDEWVGKDRIRFAGSKKAVPARGIFMPK